MNDVVKIWRCPQWIGRLFVMIGFNAVVPVLCLISYKAVYRYTKWLNCRYLNWCIVITVNGQRVHFDSVDSLRTFLQTFESDSAALTH